MAIQSANSGGIIAASLINQYGDVPGTIASAFVATGQAVTSSTYANLPTTSVAASLVTTHASTLVQILWYGRAGAGTLGTPTNNGYLSVALSGSVTLAAADAQAILGASPGATVAAISSMFVVVPAGTLTVTVQSRWATASGMTWGNVGVQVVAVRPV